MGTDERLDHAHVWVQICGPETWSPPALVGQTYKSFLEEHLISKHVATTFGILPVTIYVKISDIFFWLS